MINVCVVTVVKITIIGMYVIFIIFNGIVVSSDVII